MKAGRYWCIYRTTNLINGKTYIGQHKYYSLNDGYLGSGNLLKRAIEKYGKDNFKTEYLVTKIPLIEYANNAEQMYIAQERALGKSEYNIDDGGTSGEGCHNKATRQKISKSLIGNKRALGKNIGNQNAKGNHLSEQTRKQMGISRLGNKNNGCAYIRCIETGKILRTREWIKEGFANAYAVASGRNKTCKGMHFEYITIDLT